MPRLTDSQIVERLGALPAWSRDGNRLRREIAFPTFPDAVAFIVRLGFAAEAADHHPDLEVHWRRVTVFYWTHSEGGITEKDVAGAATADRVAAAFTSP
jgi:4a-hydroxytetrahydrobiopterin dehydratase